MPVVREEVFAVCRTETVYIAAWEVVVIWDMFKLEIGNEGKKMLYYCDEEIRENNVPN